MQNAVREWENEPLVDLHVHASLPLVGSTWRRHVQNFRIESLDNPKVTGRATERPFRIYGAVFYLTYLLRPKAARERLFKSLHAFQDQISNFRFGKILRNRNDLDLFETGDFQLNADKNQKDCRETFFLAVESARYLRDPGDIRRLWDLGVRSMQPIHFLDTKWGGSSREGILPESRMGLSGLGKEMLAEMDGLGMILDIAHMSQKNAEESLAIYRGPVICSHTGLFSLKRSARNINSELVAEIFHREGLVGVTAWQQLLGSDLGPKTEQDDKMDAWTRSYCATVAAISALALERASSKKGGVAIGSDRGAPIQVPDWFYSPAQLAKMQSCLFRYGWTTEMFKDFIFNNAREFLKRSLPSQIEA